MNINKHFEILKIKTDYFLNCYTNAFLLALILVSLFCSYTKWNDKIVVLKKTTLQLYFKTFIEKISSANLIM